MPKRRGQPPIDQDFGRDPDIGKEDRHGRAAVGRRATVGSEGEPESWEAGDVGERDVMPPDPNRKG